MSDLTAPRPATPVGIATNDDDNGSLLDDAAGAVTGALNPFDGLAEHAGEYLVFTAACALGVALIGIGAWRVIA